MVLIGVEMRFVRKATSVAVALLVGASAVVSGSLPTQAGVGAATATRTAAGARCSLSLATFGAEGLSLKNVSASVPVRVSAQPPVPMPAWTKQVVSVPELKLRAGAGTFHYHAGILLTGGRAATVDWWTEPPSDPYVKMTNRRVPAMRQLVASTRREGPVARNAPRDPARASVTYSLESGGRLVRHTGEFTGRLGTAYAMRGFGDVKAMTLISRSDRYDMLLANLTDGRLITIRVPAGTRPVPARTLVRRGGWKQFDRLVAGPCGARGTVVMGLDTKLRSAWLYDVGFAKGTATPIRKIGRVPGTWNGPQTTPVVTTAGIEAEVIRGG